MRLMPNIHPLAEGALIGSIITFFAWWFTKPFVEVPFNLEFLAVWTSFMCTYMFVIQTRWCYVLGVITTTIYSWVFWEANLIGSMILNLYLVPTLLYGYFIWGRDEVTKPVEHLQLRYLPWYILATLLTYLGALGVVTLAGGEMATLDAWILIGTVLAQYLLDRKKLETWLVWIAVNVVSIYVYLNADLPFVTIQYVFFLVNTLFGYAMWYKSMKKEQLSLA